MTSSITAGSRPVRVNECAQSPGPPDRRIARAASEPPCRPIGVLTASTMTACLEVEMFHNLLSFRAVGDRPIVGDSVHIEKGYGECPDE